MPATYDSIASTTLSTATASVTFSSISGSFTDLVLVVNGAVTTGNPSVLMRVNSDSGTNYSFTRLTGNGTAAASARVANDTAINPNSLLGITTTFETNLLVHFMNYSNTTTNKTILARANTPSAGTEASVNLWRNTGAINSIQVLLSTATTFISGSTFTLYGIKAA